MLELAVIGLHETHLVFFIFTLKTTGKFFIFNNWIIKADSVTVMVANMNTTNKKLTTISSLKPKVAIYDGKSRRLYMYRFNKNGLQQK